VWMELSKLKKRVQIRVLGWSRFLWKEEVRQGHEYGWSDRKLGQRMELLKGKGRVLDKSILNPFP
jgi:hypothetical protein